MNQENFKSNESSNYKKLKDFPNFEKNNSSFDSSSNSSQIENLPKIILSNNENDEYKEISKEIDFFREKDHNGN